MSMQGYRVPRGRVSEIFGVNNIDDSNPWVKWTAKILDGLKRDWGHNIHPKCTLNWPLQLRHGGSDKWYI